MKSALRKSLIARRRALPLNDRRRATLRAIHRIERLPQWKPNARVAVYESFGSELDTHALMAAARRRGVRLCVPKLTDLKRRRMLFVPLDAARGGTFQKIRARTARDGAVAPQWLNLIVAPIVGIDPTGVRVGMGAGFFDRALAFRQARRAWKGPLIVAIGFDFQRIDRIAAHPWDVRLDAVATESALVFFSRGES